MLAQPYGPRRGFRYADGALLLDTQGASLFALLRMGRYVGPIARISLLHHVAVKLPDLKFYIILLA